MIATKLRRKTRLAVVLDMCVANRLSRRCMPCKNVPNCMVKNGVVFCCGFIFVWKGAGVLYADSSSAGHQHVVAMKSDIVIVCVASMSGEGHDRTSMKLSATDESMIQRMGALKPTVSKSLMVTCVDPCSPSPPGCCIALYRRRGHYGVVVQRQRSGCRFLSRRGRRCCRAYRFSSHFLQVPRWRRCCLATKIRAGVCQ